jgi:hypothetical protein
MSILDGEDYRMSVAARALPQGVSPHGKSSLFVARTRTTMRGPSAAPTIRRIDTKSRQSTVVHGSLRRLFSYHFARAIAQVSARIEGNGREGPAVEILARPNPRVLFNQRQTIGSQEIVTERAMLRILLGASVEDVAELVQQGDFDEEFWGPQPDIKELRAATHWNLVERARRRQKALSDSLDLANAARRLGQPSTAVLERLRQGDLVALHDSRKQPHFPRWQFETDGEPPIPIARIARLFAGGPVELTLWMGNPNPDLGDDTPAERIQRGDVQSVLKALEALSPEAW